jgi:cytochrome c oxidase assembly factor CtaG
MSREMSIPVTFALIAAALVYLCGWYRMRKALPNLISWRRLAAFISGVSLVWTAIGSPLATLDHQMLTAHMAEHLLLMTVAAPLILLGAPTVTLLHGLPQNLVHGALRPLAPSRAVNGLGDIVTHPAFCWLVSTSVVIGWHIPAVFEQGMHSAGWHAMEHASFLAAGLLFWWPVIQPWPSIAEWPRWRIPLYLFLATLPCDALSAFLTFCNRVVYPHYLTAHGVFFHSALADQECAGALMWVCVTFAYLLPGVVATIQMLSQQRRTSQVEAI